MAPQLLLDEMFPQAMADQLNAKGHDVRAVVANPEFVGLPDEDILIGATEAGRALVTANIKDFMPIDARYRAANRVHAGLIMVSSKTFPQNRVYVTAVTTALDALLATMAASKPAESFSSPAPEKPDQARQRYRLVKVAQAWYRSPTGGTGTGQGWIPLSSAGCDSARV